MRLWVPIGLAGAGALSVALLIGGQALAVCGTIFLVAALTSQAAVQVARRGVRAAGGVECGPSNAADAASVQIRLRGWPLRGGMWRLVSFKGEFGLAPGNVVRGPRVSRVRGGVDLHWSVEGLRRGVYSLDDAQIAIGDPLGLAQARLPVDDLGAIEIGPKLIAGVGVLAGQSTARGGLIRDTRRSGVGELIGVRDYRPGDPLNRIHWPQTARRRKLQTAERSGGDPDPGRTWVLLDAGPGSDLGTALDAFELAVSCATTLALVLASTGELAAFEHCGAPGDLVRGGPGLAGRVFASATRVTCGGSTPVGARINALAQVGGRPKTLALVSALGGGELASAVGAAMRTGLRIRVLLIGTEAAGTRATLGRLGADVSTASTPDEVARALGPVSAQYVAA